MTLGHRADAVEDLDQDASGTSRAVLATGVELGGELFGSAVAPLHRLGQERGSGQRGNLVVRSITTKPVLRGCRSLGTSTCTESACGTRRSP